MSKLFSVPVPTRSAALAAFCCLGLLAMGCTPHITFEIAGKYYECQEHGTENQVFAPEKNAAEPDTIVSFGE